jgi:YHS domain-containing protein
METLFYFLLWGEFFFVMMRFGCGAHVMGHGHARKMPGDSQSPDGNGAVRPQKAVDPVCGKSIETAGARTAIHEGRTYYFCSQSCHEKFETSPQTYPLGAALTPLKMETSHEHQH